MLTTLGAGKSFTAPPFSPSDIAGLVWWIDAYSGVSGTPVATWSDRSASANNATQATGSLQPTYTANYASTGLPAVVFDGTDDAMSLGSTISLTGPFSIFFAYTSTDPNNTRMLLGVLGAPTNKIGRNGNPSFIRILNAGSSSAALTLGMSRQMLWVKRDASDKVDAAIYPAAATRLYSDVAQVGTSAWNQLGAGQSTQYWQGAIHEILIYNVDITGSNFTNVMTYLDGKW